MKHVKKIDFQQKKEDPNGERFAKIANKAKTMQNLPPSEGTKQAEKGKCREANEKRKEAR